MYLHLVRNLTLGKEFEVQYRNFLTWIGNLNQNYIEFLLFLLEFD
jgi:hypothetical protein